MNRRAFLQLFIGTVAVATIPIPKFLTPKEKPTFVDDGIGFSSYGSSASSNANGTLTPEMIEEAAMRLAQNFGRPDVMLMNKKDYKKVAKMFGYKVIYRGDDIAHVRI